MRDPARIEKILSLIRTAWLTNPDQRLGQLLANYAYGHHKDIFYVEDEVVSDRLQNYLRDPSNPDNWRI